MSVSVYTDDELSSSSGEIDYESTPQSPELSEKLKLDAILKPFELEWIFGFTSQTVINLTLNDQSEIFYGCGNFGIFFDYIQRKIRRLEGHRNMVSSFSTDEKAQYLVTADHGKDCAILFWNTITKDLILSIFEPYRNGVCLVSMSLNAKYVASIGVEYGQWKFDFWVWTLGNDFSDGTFSVSKRYGNPKAIRFHPNKNECMMIVFEYKIVYVNWENDELTQEVMPESPPDAGAFVDGTFIENCHESVAGTAKGNIAVFGNTFFVRDFHMNRIDNTKVMFVKIVQITESISFVKSVDEVVIVGGDHGEIIFYDKCIKLLFWLDLNLKSVRDVSVAPFMNYEQPLPSRTKIAFPKNSIVLDKTSYESTLEKKPFTFRDITILTKHGEVFNYSFTTRILTQLTYTVDDSIVAIQVHTGFPYLVVGYKKGHLELYNYDTKDRIRSTVLPPECPKDNSHIVVLRYCPNSYHLACSKSNGALLMLDPVTLEMRYPHAVFYAKSKIVNIHFRQDSYQMACYDSNMTVYIFNYDEETKQWDVKGKVRSHYKTINAGLFHTTPPHHYYTIGADRYLVKYNNASEKQLDLNILSRDRIEQRDTPVFFICYSSNRKYDYFLVADDKFKYKMLNEYTVNTTSVFVGPAHGCFKNSPVCKMEFLPQQNEKYLVFRNKTHIGLQLMPPDGNPYNYVGCMGHPMGLIDFQLSKDGKYMFTIGHQDSTVFMWKINVEAVQNLHRMGGTAMQPFYCLLEGGKNGWLFQEMQDLFFYMQILSEGESLSLPRVMKEYISVTEIPDLVRACGYFPTQFEIENLLTDIKWREYEETGQYKMEVSFFDFVKLFINHRPAHGYTRKNLEKAFLTFIQIPSDDSDTEVIESGEFINTLTSMGEPLPYLNLHKMFITLMRVEDFIDERDFEFMPDTIDFETFADEMLGVNI